MPISSIVRLTFGIKDHRVGSVHFEPWEVRIELDVKKKRKFPYGLCWRRLHAKDKLKERRWRHVSL